MEDKLIWIDLETTGLKPETDVILEIATIITDKNLEIIAEGPNLVVHQNEESLKNIDPWALEQHTTTGLLDEVRKSEISTEMAEKETLEFIKQHVDEGGVLCGNTVWQDKRFLMKYMSELNEYMHYRVIDVTGIKELVRRWYGAEYIPTKKEKTHRALDDIKESIGELLHYRENFFKK